MSTTLQRVPRCPSHGRHTAGCQACRTWSNWYKAWRRQKMTAGQWQPMTPAATVCTHLAALVESGMAIRALARVVGADPNNLRLIADGTRKHVSPLIADLVLAVGPDRAQARYVPVIGVRRRLEALQRIGYSLDAVGLHLGVSPKTPAKWLTNGRVTAKTATRVDRLYEELSGTPGPSARAVRRATRLGYAPPLAWDDDTIDDPAAMPNLGRKDEEVVDEVAVERVLAGQLRFGVLRPAEKVALFREAGSRYNRTELSRRLRASGESVDKWQARALRAVA